MAVSYKDNWELKFTKFELAEIDIDRGLDFPIQTGCNFWWKIDELKYKNIDYFLLLKITYLWECQKPDEKERGKSTSKSWQI